jgi:hypothetical protein
VLDEFAEGGSGARAPPTRPPDLPPFSAHGSYDVLVLLGF